MTGGDRSYESNFLAGSKVSIQIACLVQYVQSVILPKVIFLSQIHVCYHKNTQKVARETQQGFISWIIHNRVELRNAI